MRLVAAAVASLLLAPVASADPTFTSSALPSRIAYPGRTQVEYALTIRTGADAERFSVAAELPVLDVAGGGLPLRFERLVAAGAGRVLGRRQVAASPGCAPSAPARYHGYRPVAESLDLALPPQSETVLRATYEARRFAFWPGVDLDLRFALGRPFDGAPATVKLPQRIATQGPSVRRRRSGLRIDLRTAPASSYSATARPRRIARGTPIAIFGQVHPRLQAEEVRLAWTGPGARLQTLAHVRTDARGRFRLTDWRPVALGIYELWAFAKATTANVVDDHRCPRTFRLVA